MKRIAVLTSGGDAPGMNAAVRAVVRTATANNMSVIGFKRGYNGVLMQNQNADDDYMLMTARKVSGIVHRGGTVLMTARCKEFLQPKFQQQAIDNSRQQPQKVMPVHVEKKVGRNDPCPCGSGKKYKNCHGRDAE